MIFLSGRKQPNKVAIKRSARIKNKETGFLTNSEVNEKYDRILFPIMDEIKDKKINSNPVVRVKNSTIPNAAILLFPFFPGKTEIRANIRMLSSSKE